MRGVDQSRSLAFAALKESEDKNRTKKNTDYCHYYVYSTNLHKNDKKSATIRFLGSLSREAPKHFFAESANEESSFV